MPLFRLYRDFCDLYDFLIVLLLIIILLMLLVEMTEVVLRRLVEDGYRYLIATSPSEEEMALVDRDELDVVVKYVPARTEEEVLGYEMVDPESYGILIEDGEHELREAADGLPFVKFYIETEGMV